MSSLTSLLSEAEASLPATIALRRDIHAHPELGLSLPRTQSVILDAIDELGLDVSTGQDLSSVTAVLETGRPGPTTLLRADMDALPLREDTGLEFASTVEGAMHACGHDTHVAMLVSAARLLHDHRNELNGRVVYMFQPGEEGHHGARFMIDEGVLDVAGRIDLAFAIHQSPSIPSRMITTRGGTIMASADEVIIEVVGRGGHASAPHQALDPIPVACEIVLAMQSMVTRRFDAFDPAVVTIAQIESGTTNNVIPERARLNGTIRTVSARTRQRVRDEITRLASGIAAAHGATAEIVFVPGFPVTINDHAVADWVRAVATDVLSTRVIDMPAPVMGAEDFSYVLEKVPGAMAFLGTCPPEVHFSEAAPNHSNRMMLDESAMAAGVALYAGVALAKSAAAS